MPSLRASWPHKRHRPASGASPGLTVSLVLLAGAGAVGLGHVVVKGGVRPLGYLAAAAGTLLVLLRPRVGLYLMLFLLPLQNLFAFGSESEPGGTSLVRVVGTLVFMAWAAQKLARKEPIGPLVRGPLFVPMAVFLLICTASVLWAGDIDRWRVSLFTFVQLVAWVVMLIDLIDSWKALWRAVFFLAFGCMIGFGRAIYDAYVMGVSRSSAGVLGENAFGAVAISILPFMFLLVIHRRGWLRAFGLIGAVAAVLAIGAVSTRLALLSFPLVMVLQLHEWFRLSKKGTGVLLFLLVALVVVVIFPLLPLGLIHQDFSILIEEQLISSGGRGPRVLLALGAFVSRPLLGQGLGNLEIPGYPFFTVHNLPVQILGELGLVGLLALVWVLAVAWRSLFVAWGRANALQDRKAVAFLSALGLGFLMYLLYSLTISNQDSRFLWLLIALTEICYRLTGNQLPASRKAMLQAAEGRVS